MGAAYQGSLESKISMTSFRTVHGACMKYFCNFCKGKRSYWLCSIIELLTSCNNLTNDHKKL